MLNQTVRIVESYDSLVIYANGTKFTFDRNEPFDKLVDVFKELKLDDVTYEEVPA